MSTRPKAFRLAAATAVLVVAAAGLLLPSAGGAESRAAKRAAVLAKEARCVIKVFSDQGREHSEDPVVYKTNPPTSGPHHPEWAEDGVYAPGDEPQVEKWVHTLEHGRVLIQYRPGSSARRIAALTSIARERFNGRRGYHQLLFQNNTEMRYAVAAITWRRYLGCPRFDARVARAIRAFRRAYVDKAPELIP